MTQRFRENDSTELDIINLALPTLTDLGTVRDVFESEAFQCFLLGDVLYDLARDPLAGVITQDVFRTSFFAIHELFTRPGTFEFYLSVFRAIFTQETEIEFEIPGPGQLIIRINALVFENFNLQAREIIDGVYEYFNLVTSDTNDFIMTQGTRGIKTQAEMDSLIPEISAYGIYTTVELLFE